MLQERGQHFPLPEVEITLFRLRGHWLLLSFCRSFVFRNSSIFAFILIHVCILSAAVQQLNNDPRLMRIG